MTQEQSASETMMSSPAQQAIETTCCVVGGGPAGAILALLLARQDIPVVLLEAHMDFNREFRGDTLHPSTLTILDELGLMERLQKLEHTIVPGVTAETPGGQVRIGDFSRLPAKYPYIMLIPQADFLTFITDEAKRYPSFQLLMGAQVDELLEEDGRVCGVRYRGTDGNGEVRAALTVGADGRFSRLRKLAGFEPIKTSVPMDILWFQLSRKANDPEQSLGRFTGRHIFVTLPRHHYWQLGYVIPKGAYQEIRAAGLEAFRRSITEMAPLFIDRVKELQEWKQVLVLSVESNRLPRWYRPGLLLIGDAAHVMSPVGGVGINYAIQDAVEAFNLLANKLKYGVVETRDLAKLQARRMLPTRVIQGFQNLLQAQFLARVLDRDKPVHFNPALRFLMRFSAVRSIPGRLIGIGLWQVHVKK